MLNILFVTSNQNKLNEISLLANNKIKIDQLELELEELQALDVQQVVKAKLRQALLKNKLQNYDYVMIEDTSLEIIDWGNFPGALIKWLLNSVGTENIHKMLYHFDPSAKVICVLGLVNLQNKKEFYFRGELEGKIVAPKGNLGFGWDKIFQPNNQSLTLGEMPTAEKNKISHRSIAVNKMLQWTSTIE